MKTLITSISFFDKKTFLPPPPLPPFVPFFELEQVLVVMTHLINRLFSLSKSELKSRDKTEE
jgi:hypothetical protein